MDRRGFMSWIPLIAIAPFVGFGVQSKPQASGLGRAPIKSEGALIRSAEIDSFRERNTQSRSFALGFRVSNEVLENARYGRSVEAHFDALARAHGPIPSGEEDLL